MPIEQASGDKAAQEFARFHAGYTGILAPETAYRNAKTAAANAELALKGVRVLPGRLEQQAYSHEKKGGNGA